MNAQDKEPLAKDSDARRFEKEIHDMVPELNRPYKLENAELTNSILKTTFEEFLILYGVDARFREGYTESEALVNIPNLFVKVICDRESKNSYIQQLHRSNSPGMLRTGFNSPLYQRSYGSDIDYSVFFSNDVLDRETLKKSPGYALSALKASYQSIWLSKLEFILNNREQLFTEAFDLSTGQIIETIVRMRPAVIELYNWFDFQGPVPKLLVDDSTTPYDPKESMRSSLALLFLTLCDIDVVVLNDSHGATFENYVSETCYTCYYPEPTSKGMPGGTVGKSTKPSPVIMGLAVLVIFFLIYKLIF